MIDLLALACILEEVQRRIQEVEGLRVVDPEHRGCKLVDDNLEEVVNNLEVVLSNSHLVPCWEMLEPSSEHRPVVEVLTFFIINYNYLGK